MEAKLLYNKAGYPAGYQISGVSLILFRATGSRAEAERGQDQGQDEGEAVLQVWIF